jgi:hypothetical protein
MPAESFGSPPEKPRRGLGDLVPLASSEQPADVEEAIRLLRRLGDTLTDDEAWMLTRLADLPDIVGGPGRQRTHDG